MEITEVTAKPQWTCDCGRVNEIFCKSLPEDPQLCRDCGSYSFLRDGKAQLWKVKGIEDSCRWVVCSTGTHEGFIISTWSGASRLARTLNLFEAMKDERRWSDIAVEQPEPYSTCEIKSRDENVSVLYGYAYCPDDVDQWLWAEDGSLCRNTKDFPLWRPARPE